MVAKKRELSVFDVHQLRIAKSTLRMTDEGANVMGGPTKAEARKIILKLTGGPVWERKFGGMTYTHYTTWGLSKIGAVNEAKYKRKNGNLARVVKLKDGYHVYVHFEKRRKME